MVARKCDLDGASPHFKIDATIMLFNKMKYKNYFSKKEQIYIRVKNRNGPASPKRFSFSHFGELK